MMLSPNFKTIHWEFNPENRNLNLHDETNVEILSPESENKKANGILITWSYLCNDGNDVFIKSVANDHITDIQYPITEDDLLTLINNSRQEFQNYIMQMIEATEIAPFEVYFQGLPVIQAMKLVSYLNHHNCP